MKQKFRSRRLPCLSIVLSLLLLLSACSSGKQLLYSVTDGSRTYEVYGSASKPSRIRVTENGSTVWEKKVKVKNSVGDQNGTYGFAVLDLNFDGRNDIKIAVEADGEQFTEVCFLQKENGKYERSDAFSGLYTVGVNPELETVFSFSHTEQTEPSAGEAPEGYSSTDTTTAYLWESDKLVPYLRVSLTYYSEQNIYCYSVSNYSNETGSFTDSDDKWLSPEEFKNTDFGFLYYFR